MKEDYAIHNLFLKSLDEFEKYDPQLSKLIGLPLVHHPDLIEEIPVSVPGIYILTGGRQVGKSTTLKLIISQLLKRKKMRPEQIYYLPCDTVKDYKQLMFEIDQFRHSLREDEYFVLIIDEINFVEEWPRTIKSLADAGFFNFGSLIISGSDTCLLKDAMMGFPGRRGRADKQDFHLYPLSFFEYTALTRPELKTILEKTREEFQRDLTIKERKPDFETIKALQKAYYNYLLTGGYLLAINDYEKNKAIGNATFKTYTQWIVGDILKRGKSEEYLKEIINAIILRLCKQVTWNSLAADLTIDHHSTIVDYVDLLSRMDVAVILKALKEDKLRAAPKKAKKICFSDPFILHALRGWINNERSNFELAKKLVKESSDMRNALIESSVSALFHRGWESYYIKADGEIDLALVRGRKVLPIEIKNSLSLGQKELKQILKYKLGIIGYAGSEIGQFNHLQVIPIPLLAYLAN